jgi:AcrR family transcriptional regulator
MPRPYEEPARGRSAVEEALIEAASELLAETGPTTTSVRDIAGRAGVNHAQVHHYFGGKRGLLKEAMRRMASAHHEALADIAGERPFPPAMTMPLERYLQAVVRAAIEGDIELAGIEISEGMSAWRTILDHLTSRAGLTEPDTDVKAALAAGAAMQLGWLALEPIIFLIADVQPDEQDEIRDRVRRTVYRVQAQVYSKPGPATTSGEGATVPAPTEPTAASA